MDERRHFTRIIFSTPAQLSRNDHTWDVNLLDLSLKGALVSIPVDERALPEDTNAQYELSFLLPDSDVVISMQVTIVHIEDRHLGLSCHQIGIDSVTHLRRMVELNTGDILVLNRELANLSASGHE